MIYRDEQLERKVCAAICQSNGVKAREIAALLKLDRNTVNHIPSAVYTHIRRASFQ